MCTDCIPDTTGYGTVAKQCVGRVFNCTTEVEIELQRRSEEGVGMSRNTWNREPLTSTVATSGEHENKFYFLYERKMKTPSFASSLDVDLFFAPKRRFIFCLASCTIPSIPLTISIHVDISIPLLFIGRQLTFLPKFLYLLLLLPFLG